MIVVSDTSPLNYLVLIEAVEVLPVLFSQVLIPPKVFDELQHERTPSAVSDWVRHAPQWLTIQAPRVVEHIPGLHRGECEAIALATESANSTLLVDERDAGKVAARRGLRVIGTLAILDEAATRELFDLRLKLDRLRQTNFRAPESMLNDLLRRDAERRARRQA